MGKFIDIISKLDVRKILGSLYGFVLLLNFALGSLNLALIVSADRDFTYLRSNIFEGTIILSRLQKHYFELKLITSTFLMRSNKSLRSEARNSKVHSEITQQVAQLQTKIEQEVHLYRRLADTNTESSLLAHWDSLYPQYKSQLSLLLTDLQRLSSKTFVQSGTIDHPRALLETTSKQMEDTLSALLQFQIEESEGDATTFGRNLRKNKFLLILLAAIGAAVLTLVTWVAVRRIELIIQELEANETRFRLSSEAGRIGIWDFHLGTQELLLSGSTRELFGISDSNKIIDKDEIFALIHPDDLKDVEKLIQNAIDGQGQTEGEFRILPKNGRVLWLSLRLKVLRGKQGVTRILGVTVDISQQKETEFAIEESQKKTIETLSKMSILGEIAGGIGHEINNPLAIIQLSAETTRSHLSLTPPDLKAAENSITQIEKGASRIAKIVSGLRAFSRNGSQDPFVSSSIKTTLDETIAFIGQRLKRDKVALFMDTLPFELAIDCRPAELSQVFVNFISNSLDAIESLPEKWIRITITDLGECVEISFIDSGKGIPKTVAEKMFKESFTSKPVGKGTGLGLGICKRIIEDHQGIVFVDDRCPNTRIAMRLPKKHSQSPPVPSVLAA